MAMINNAHRPENASHPPTMHKLHKEEFSKPERTDSAAGDLLGLPASQPAIEPGLSQTGIKKSRAGRIKFGLELINLLCSKDL
jgi:hypothetical protein